MFRPAIALTTLIAATLPASAHTTAAPHVHAETGGFALVLGGLLVISVAATVARRTARSRA